MLGGDEDSLAKGSDGGDGLTSVGERGMASTVTIPLATELSSEVAADGDEMSAAIASRTVVAATFDAATMRTWMMTEPDSTLTVTAEGSTDAALANAWAISAMTSLV